jgi:hypothetical protein
VAPELSPESEQIAVTRCTQRRYVGCSIVVGPTDGSGEFRPLVAGSMGLKVSFAPALSTSGRRVAGVGTKGRGDLTVWTVKADGSDLRRVVLLTGGEYRGTMDWHGSRIYYADGRNLRVVNPCTRAGHVVVAQQRAEVHNPQVSPNGRHLVADVVSDDADGVYCFRRDDTHFVKLAARLRHYWTALGWNPRGTRVIAVRSDRLFSFDAQTGTDGGVRRMTECGATCSTSGQGSLPHGDQLAVLDEHRYVAELVGPRHFHAELGQQGERLRCGVPVVVVLARADHRQLGARGGEELGVLA